MSSRKSIKVKTKSYNHRKKWLNAKVQHLKSYYEEVLSAFKLRLDNIVNPVIDDASRVLSEENENTFFTDVYEVGIGVERCMNDLFEINLLCCDSSLSSDEQSELDDGDEDKNVQHCTSEQSSQNLSNPRFPTTNSSTPLHVKSPSKSIDKPASTPSKSDSPTNNCPSSKCSLTQTDSALVLQSSCGKNIHLFSAEIDLLLLHNIKFGEKRSVLVSDVISPSSFSVQPKECRDQLMNLQQSLNALYSEQWTEQLQFVEKPKLGTICVAKFIIDHCWYRAKIIKELPNSNYEVMYIDYGNRTVVKMEDLRVIDPRLGNIPQLSIQCSLFGVEPVAKGDSNNEWSLPATEWFDQQIFGKTFTVQFAPHSTSGVLPCYSAHLYTAITKSDGEQTSWSVADNMVCMGFAAFATTLPTATSSEKGDNVQVSEEKQSCIPQQTLTKQVGQPSCSNDLQVIPAGVESSGKSNAFQKSSINYQQLVPNTHKFRMNVRPLHNIVQENEQSQSVHLRPMPIWLSPICSSVALVDSCGRVYQQVHQRYNF